MALAHDVFGGVGAGMPECLVGNRVRAVLLHDKVARVVVRIHVVL